MESHQSEKIAAIQQINLLNEKVKEQQKEMECYKSSIKHLYEKIEELGVRIDDSNAKRVKSIKVDTVEDEERASLSRNGNETDFNRELSNIDEEFDRHSQQLPNTARFSFKKKINGVDHVISV